MLASTSLKILSLVLSLAYLASSAPLQPSSVVDLGYAKFQGTIGPFGVRAWYGLRYAAPASGELRWRPPVDIEKCNNFTDGRIYNASQFGPRCMQAYPDWEGRATQATRPKSKQLGSEDCLLLNVLAPAEPVSNSLPVVIQIHGGGYVQGNSTSTDGSYLVSRSNGNIIYVEIQYRLGGLGFLGSKDIRSDGTANAGILDQRAAIEWVQRHISAFGGDLTRVTLMGGSAGGGSISAQMMLYGGEAHPPFRAAIVEYPWFQPLHDEPILEAQYNEILQAAGCGDLACLRVLPYETLFDAINATYFTGYSDGKQFGYGDFYFGPTVDESIIKGLPSAEYAAGKFSKVPTIINHNALEGLAFTNFSLNSDAEVTSSLSQIWQTKNESFLSTLDQLWPPADFDDQYLATEEHLAENQYVEAAGFAPVFASIANNSYVYRQADIVGAGFINCPTAHIATNMQSRGVPVWKLVYSSGVLIHGAVTWGVLLGPSPNANESQSAMVQDYYLSFITELDPNNGSFTESARPVWPAYGDDAMVLDVNLTSVTQNFDRDRSERCNFLLENGAILRN